MGTMKRLVLILFALIALPAMAQPVVVAPDIYTNEEQVYFEGEARRVAPHWIEVWIEESGDGLVWQSIDRFGTLLSSEPIRVAAASWTIGDCVLALGALDGALNFKASAKGCEGRALPLVLDARCLALRMPDGSQAVLLRARPFVCWMTVKRDTLKPDGSEDWLFTANMQTHDQGGRLRLGGGDSGAPEAIIRIRNVVWPPPTRNRPSPVLYVFTPDDIDRAVAYGWADPAAVRTGINQRWMQASCTLASFTLNGAE